MSDNTLSDEDFCLIRQFCLRRSPRPTYNGLAGFDLAIPAAVLMTMRLLRTLLLHLLLLLATAVTMYPVLWVLKMALSPSQSFALTPTRGQPSSRLATSATCCLRVTPAASSLFMRQFLNSVIVSAAVICRGSLLLLGGVRAVAIPFSWSPHVAGVFSVRADVSGVVTTIPLYIVLESCTCSITWGPGPVLRKPRRSCSACSCSRDFFDSPPRELGRGCDARRGTRSMPFPRRPAAGCRPALAVTALFAFLSAWNEFILAATFHEPAAYTSRHA